MAKKKEQEPETFKAVSAWLYLCCFSVFIMVVIGGITRLTGSGLSMVEWRPLMGVLPPMNEIEWQHVYGLYQQSPEYQKVNFDMPLNEFKKIFFWEWFHRLWGRSIGIIYAVPFFLFLSLGKLPKIYLPSFFGFLLLGGAQGLMGWYMVQSGLVDDPAVSHYRLAAHLMLAFLIFGLMLQMALKLSMEHSDNAAQLPPLKPHIRRSFLILIITMIWGGFVAGLDAGLVYNSFPMMGKYPWPEELFSLSPFWINFVENHASVQFVHRVLAIATGISIFSLIFHSTHFNRSPRVKLAFNLMGVMVLCQIGLGIATLLTNVNISIAVIHQAGAMVLLSLMIWINHEVPNKDFSYE